MDSEQQAQNPYGSWPPQASTASPAPMLPGGKRERIFAPILLLLSLIIGNTGPYAGLGFAIPYVLIGAVTIWYVWKKETFSAYGLACVLLSMVLAAAHGRTSDPFVLALFAPLTLGAYFLGLVAMTGANARPLGRFSSLLDVFYAAFHRTFTQIKPVIRGLFRRREQCKKVNPAFWGVLIAIPVLFLVVPLLSSADAAFEGLLSGFTKHIPKNSELITGLFWGLIVFVLAYAQAVSLRANGPRPARKVREGNIPAAGVNGFLGVISAVYLLYLLSQTAYFFSAFRGILPKDFTAADYARRGFFEMAVLVVLNLGMAGTSNVLVRKDGKAPLSTRLFSLFLLLFSLVLIATSFSKMVLYVGSFGLTQLRVMTSLFMLWLAVWVLSAMVTLFRPRFPHMKIAVLAALILACAASWADVNTVIARYNVTAYQTGKLETMDVESFYFLGDAAVPYASQLTEDKNELVAQDADAFLIGWAKAHSNWYTDEKGVERFPFDDVDWRSWTYAEAQAREVVIDYLCARHIPISAPELQNPQ